MSRAAGTAREIPEWVREALGDESRSLPESDRRELVEFLDPQRDPRNTFRPDETQREYILHREGETVLVLLILRDGSWKRIRIAPESVQMHLSVFARAPCVHGTKQNKHTHWCIFGSRIKL